MFYKNVNATEIQIFFQKLSNYATKSDLALTQTISI